MILIDCQSMVDECDTAMDQCGRTVDKLLIRSRSLHRSCAGLYWSTVVINQSNIFSWVRLPAFLRKRWYESLIRDIENADAPKGKHNIVMVHRLRNDCAGQRKGRAGCSERPGWGGTTLQVCYYMRNAPAVINGKEPVYAKAVIWLQDGSYRWQVLPLAGTDTLCQKDGGAAGRRFDLHPFLYAQ